MKLNDTYYPFAKRLKKLLAAKKISRKTIIKAESILIKACMRSIETGYYAGLNKKKK